MIKINSDSKRSKYITGIYENPFYIYELAGKGTYTARLYVFFECA